MTEAQTKKTVGVAIASLVCGCFFFIPFLNFLSGLAAVILGIVALVTISKNKDSLKGNGLAIGGIVLGSIGLILTPVIMMFAAIAIPNFMRARMVAQESAATASLQTISAASQVYYADKGRYPQELLDLAYSSPPYIDESLGSGTHQGYMFKIVDTGNEDTFLATAVPESSTSGVRVFCVVEDGIVRADYNGSDISNYEGCRECEPTRARHYRY
ncbi:MAG: DUF4190 domain-containing protein [Candidatus Omnitrophota bacterium]|nr:MAG: DUF4190 domain-containing protein [Candidatus Omnitrophota bacterium]